MGGVVRKTPVTKAMVPTPGAGGIPRCEVAWEGRRPSGTRRWSDAPVGHRYVTAALPALSPVPLRRLQAPFLR